MLPTSDPYIYTLVGKSYATNDIVGYQIYVDSGPGKGSTRIIEGNSGDRVRLNSPLAVTATLDTKIVLRIPQEDFSAAVRMLSMTAVPSAE